MKNVKFYTLGEEIFNSVTHGVGAGLGVAGCVLMIVKAAFSGSAVSVVSASLFGAALIVLYTMSTLYHAITNDTAKHVFRIFDHCTIYFLIAGTYTPYTLVAFGGALGWTMFGILWGLTALGVTLSAVSLEKFKKIQMLLYVGMGWCVVLASKTLFSSLAIPGIIFLFLGGLSYTLGIIFYKMNKIKYMHSIWHLFVLAGSILHFFSVYFYVL